ncbi:MAG: alpha-glucan family phosphorylase, partial [Planctomycetota bacterium]
VELGRQIMGKEERAFLEVKNRVAACTVFTTHTPVQAGHDRFDPGLIEYNAGPLRERIQMEEDDFLALGRENPLARDEQFCMTVLGMKMSHHINGVSTLHEAVSREMWQGIWASRAVQDVPIDHITNAVHIPSWLAVPMARFYQRLLGPDWQENICDNDMWSQIQNMDEEEFWEQQQIIKVQLVNFLHRRICKECGSKQKGNILHKHENLRLDPSNLTIGFARRFTGYKRANLLLGDLDRLDNLVNDPERPVQIIFAGKAHPEDETGKKLIQRIISSGQDRRFRGRIVFVEDYDINVARHLVQGVDLWLNCPRRPQEACGTSGQKIVLNGGLNLAVLDGWWPEGYNGDNGFAIGDGRQHANETRQDEYDMDELYTVLEDDVIPEYYRRGTNGIPREWIERQKRAIRSLACKFNAKRMLKDYTLQCYLPAAGAATS